MFEAGDPDEIPSHLRSNTRHVKPPEPVWVDLGAVYPLRERPRRFVDDGLNLQATVPGLLHMWTVTATGQAVGYVVFGIPGGDGSQRAAQWVFRNALSPRHDSPARRDHR